MNFFVCTVILIQFNYLYFSYMLQIQTSLVFWNFQNVRICMQMNIFYAYTKCTVHIPLDPNSFAEQKISETFFLSLKIDSYFAIRVLSKGCIKKRFPLVYYRNEKNSKRWNILQKVWYEQTEIFLSIHPSLPSPQLNSKAESLVFVRGQDCPGLRDRDDEEGHRHQEPHLLSTDRK